MTKFFEAMHKSSRNHLSIIFEATPIWPKHVANFNRLD